MNGSGVESLDPSKIIATRGRKMSADYTLNELMIIESARHIRDGETVFVGTGMPMVAAMFAQKTHAPNVCFVVETGPISPEVLPVPVSVSDPKAMHRAAKLGTLREVLGCILQRGMADVGFLGELRSIITETSTAR